MSRTTSLALVCLWQTRPRLCSAEGGRLSTCGRTPPQAAVPLVFRLLLAGALLPALFAFGPEQPEGPAPAPDLKDVTVIEHPGASLPLDLKFVDESGQTVTLGQYFTGKRPVVLQLGYYGCPMLCGLISQGTVTAFKAVSLEPAKDYDFIFVSIDPSEKPELADRKKQAYMMEFGREGAAGWHFLTGTQDAIAPLAEAVGFKYKWVQSAGQFAHPAAIMMCTPDGKISRYLYGVQFDPQTVRLSLVEASNGKIGNVIDHAFLTCFQYDGHQGKYALAAIGIMRGGGLLMMIVLAAFVIRAVRREMKKQAREGP
jgi:protein SCO1/2